jgi:hypothetical protein
MSIHKRCDYRCDVRGCQAKAEGHETEPGVTHYLPPEKDWSHVVIHTGVRFPVELTKQVPRYSHTETEPRPLHLCAVHTEKLKLLFAGDV